MRNIRQPRDIGEGRLLRAEMVLRGLRVADVAEQLGWGKDTLYRVLRDDRPLTDEERDRFQKILDGAPA